MSIKVKLKNGVVTVKPMDHAKDHGTHKVHWEKSNGSDDFTFSDPPISFDDSNAPFSDISVDDGIVCATDNNFNTTGVDVDYKYHVHLRDKAGKPITWPPPHPVQDVGGGTSKGALSGRNSLLAGDPIIKNKPGGGL